MVETEVRDAGNVNVGDRMKFEPGDLVRFVNHNYDRWWGLGIILYQDVYVDHRGRKSKGYFQVLTNEGMRLVSQHWMEVV